MSWLRLVRLIRGAGGVAEAAPTLPEPLPGRPEALAGSVQIRHVDAGSCNGGFAAACRRRAGDRRGDTQHVRAVASYGRCHAEAAGRACGG
jgi:hypothetical protein